MTNITNEQEITTSIEKIYRWDNKEDKEELINFYNEADNVRIMEYVNRFYVQEKLANIKETFDNIDEIVDYKHCVNVYISTYGYPTLEEARKAIELFVKSKPVYHKVNNSDLI